MHRQTQAIARLTLQSGAKLPEDIFNINCRNQTLQLGIKVNRLTMETVQTKHNE